jgi:arsenate reductase
MRPTPDKNRQQPKSIHPGIKVPTALPVVSRTALIGLALSLGPSFRNTTMLKIYGIKNCDTMKKARAWLDGQGIEYEFHDYKKDGLDEGLLRQWVAELGWEALVNRRGTSWRALPESEREGIDEANAIALMLQNPSLIKRPVLDIGGKRLVGFSPEVYATRIQ